MGEFGVALKKARKDLKFTLMDLYERSGFSVGYISDMERGRTGPPDIDAVRRFEEILKIDDGRLVSLAEKERGRMPSQILQDLQGRPKLSDLFFRLKDLPEDKLQEWIDKPLDE